MLPGLAGDELCARLREAGNWVPILMLTARAGPEEEARALDAGADDFLAKPFSFVVLMARIRALLRRGGARAAGGPRRSATCGSTRPSTGCGAATTDIALTPRQFSLLEFLMRRPGEVLSKAVDPRARLGLRLRRRPQHRRGLRPPAAPAHRRARSAGRRCRPCGWSATGSTRTVADDGSLRSRTTAARSRWSPALVLVGGAVTLDLMLQAPAHRDRRPTWPGPGCATCSPLARTGDLPRRLVNVTDDAVAQVVDDQGRVVAASANAAGARIATDEPATGGRRLLDGRRPGRRPRPSATDSGPSTGPSAHGRVRVYVGTSLESVREATAEPPAGPAGRRPARLGAARRGDLAAGRPGVAAARPDPRRGRPHHRQRPRSSGRLVRPRRRGRPAGHDHEPDARPARAGRRAAAPASSPTSPTTCRAR